MQAGMLHLEATQELIRSRLHEAARRAEWVRVNAEASAPPEPPVAGTGGSRRPHRA